MLGEHERDDPQTRRQRLASPDLTRPTGPRDRAVALHPAACASHQAQRSASTRRPLGQVARGGHRTTGRRTVTDLLDAWVLHLEALGQSRVHARPLPQRNPRQPTALGADGQTESTDLPPDHPYNGPLTPLDEPEQGITAVPSRDSVVLGLLDLVTVFWPWRRQPRAPLIPALTPVRFGRPIAKGVTRWQKLRELSRCSPAISA